MLHYLPTIPRLSCLAIHKVSTPWCWFKSTSQFFQSVDRQFPYSPLAFTILHTSPRNHLLSNPTFQYFLSILQTQTLQFRLDSVFQSQKDSFLTKVVRFPRTNSMLQAKCVQANLLQVRQCSVIGTVFGLVQMISCCKGPYSCSILKPQRKLPWFGLWLFVPQKADQCIFIFEGSFIMFKRTFLLFYVDLMFQKLRKISGFHFQNIFQTKTIQQKLFNKLKILQNTQHTQQIKLFNKFLILFPQIIAKLKKDKTHKINQPKTFASIFSKMDQEVKLMNKVLEQDHFNVLAKLSEGSYGEIFLVENNQSGQKYVLKALEIQKLKKESRLHEALIESLILRKLKHPGIIKIHETIKRENYFSQILDYCPHGDMFKLMARINHDLNLTKKKKEIMSFYLSEILQAISYLHSNKIIHRDLKPQNIVVSDNLHIKIIDFGTALINNDEYLNEMEKDSINELKSHEKQLVGSAHYLSPQALKLEYSQKSDIWAFGVIAYKFYNNALPFVGSNNFQIFKAIKEKQPQLDEEMPMDLREVIEACLKKNSLERPSAELLKNYAYFKKTKFSTIFDSCGPIHVEEIKINPASMLVSSSPTKKNHNEDLFSSVLEKKMFFGNYKPRILAIYRKRGCLYFAYKYVDTKQTKNEVQLNMNDYCQKISKNQMEIKSDDKQYVFKCQGIQSIDKIVQEVNHIIREHFKLQ